MKVSINGKGLELSEWISSLNWINEKNCKFSFLESHMEERKKNLQWQIVGDILKIETASSREEVETWDRLKEKKNGKLNCNFFLLVVVWSKKFIAILQSLDDMPPPSPSCRTWPSWEFNQKT